MSLGNTPYWSRVEEYYNRLFDNHKRVTPFDDVIGEVDWIRVDTQNYPVYPYYGPYDPYYSYRQYAGGLDHYLVGLMRNQGRVQYIIYGVPGVYSAAPLCPCMDSPDGFLLKMGMVQVIGSCISTELPAYCISLLIFLLSL